MYHGHCNRLQCQMDSLEEMNYFQLNVLLHAEEAVVPWVKLFDHRNSKLQGNSKDRHWLCPKFGADQIFSGAIIKKNLFTLD